MFFFYTYLHYSFHKHTQHNFYEFGNYSMENLFQTAWYMVSGGAGTMW